MKKILVVLAILAVVTISVFAATQYLQVWKKGAGPTSTKAYIDTDGNFWARGTITANGNLVASSDITVSQPTDGGNAGAKNTIKGNPQLVLVSLGNMTNGTTETTRYVDDSPAGEWFPAVAAQVTGEVALTQAQLDESTDIITQNAHGFTSGQKLQYWDNGNTAPTTDPANQCDDGDIVYVIWLSANTYSLASSMANVAAGTAINFTDDGNADTQFLATAIVATEDTTYYKYGSKSLKFEFQPAAGADSTFYNLAAMANDDLNANESIGFWIYSTEALASGDIKLAVHDTDTDTSITIPAVSANVWTWVELDISTALDGAAGNVVDYLGFQLTTAGATAHNEAFSIYIDGMYKWDADDEEALYQDVEDGAVLCVMTADKEAALTGEVQTLSYPIPAQIVEQTGYFVNYQTGSDVIVTITDQSTKNGMALVAYK